MLAARHRDTGSIARSPCGPSAPDTRAASWRGRPRISMMRRARRLAGAPRSLLLVAQRRRLPAAGRGRGAPAGRWSAPRPTGYAPVNTNRRAMRPQNAHGYRDRERAVAKPPGVRRVVSLGDSFAWGASVEFEDAYPQRLERGLTRRRGEPWEVVSLALPGHEHRGPGRPARGRGLRLRRPTWCCSAYVLNDSEDSQAAETRRAADWCAAARSAPPAASTGRRCSASSAGALWATAENRRRIAGYRSMYADDAPGWVARAPGPEVAWARSAASAACRSWWRSSRSSATRSTSAIPFAEVHAKVGAGRRARRARAWWTCCPPTAACAGSCWSWTAWTTSTPTRSRTASRPACSCTRSTTWCPGPPPAAPADRRATSASSPP